MAREWPSGTPTGDDLQDSAMVIADAAGIIRFWSPGAEKTFGHSAGEAIGQSLDLIVPPEYRPAHWNGFRNAMVAGTAAAEGQTAPFPVRRADGQFMARNGRLTLLREPGGRVVAAAVVFEKQGPP